MKILLFCPTYKVGNGLAIRPETLESIEGLIRPEGVELTVKISNNNPYVRTGVQRGDHENTLFQYQLAQRLILEGDYDYLFIVEHDMIVPADALVKLLEVNAPVVYGVYLFRHKYPICNVLRSVNLRARWPDMSLSFFPELLEKARREVVTECTGSGFGCILIRRDVLEQVKMRREEVGGYPSADMPFSADCMRKGIVQKAHFGVMCGHIKSDGSVLWPDRNEANMASVKIFINRSFVANVGGKSVRFKEGEEAEMPEENALELARAGYLSIIEEEPAIKIVGNKKPAKVKAVK